MISRSLILQILQAAKIMRRFFYEAPAEIMRIYTTTNIIWCQLQCKIGTIASLPMDLTRQHSIPKGGVFLKPSFRSPQQTRFHARMQRGQE